MFGIIITIISFIIGLKLYQKTKNPILNPILISVLIILSLLIGFKIPYENYNYGAKYITKFLPVTIVILAIPLARQVENLKRNRFPIFVGISVGVFMSFISVIVLSKILNLDTDLMISLIPKSITTPLGMLVSEKLKGIVSISVVSIVITGIVGAMLGPTIFKIGKIDSKVAKGIALGTSSHAIGTSKAIEIGELEGAMSSLAIVISGIVTFICTPIFIIILKII